MKTLVTGGAGFIGSHLVERLLVDGHEVVVVDNFCTGLEANLAAVKNNSRLKICNEDVADFNGIKNYFGDIDWVFHLAALTSLVPSVEKPLDYFRSNVLGTASVLEASRKAGVKRFVYTASSSCYGIPDKHPTEEAAPIRNEYPYAATKYMGELFSLHYSRVYKLPVVSLRLFNVYGLRVRTDSGYGAALGVFLAQKANYKPFTVVGDGTQTRDFVFVTDVVDAFVRAAASDCAGEVFNVGSGNPQSVNRMIELLGPNDIVYVPKRPGEPDQTFADVGKIKKALGWEPCVSFDEGLGIIMKHAGDWKDAQVWTPEKIQEATASWFQHLKK
ncbi:MAG: NAD-dependent dehydratase [Parcubacteria group bacterium RIFCSPLOWO2_01_FULL_48_18]|nr:MAG: NAD-dependent dehydratase [Parcubacteria group bacterium RIFCSPHIGHO2_02_FULL_48_10b]OHB22765.1 MAG: NAD-dependent dehydratase [Parcubacteria group bacterium RIFCSPLOWO2_01_FULL_48_18]